MVQVTEEKTLDAILEESLNIWKAWRADHRPWHEDEWQRWTREERVAREDELCAATETCYAAIPHDKDSLLRLAADDRVWNAAEGMVEGIEEAILDALRPPRDHAVRRLRQVRRRGLVMATLTLRVEDLRGLPSQIDLTDTETGRTATGMMCGMLRLVEDQRDAPQPASLDDYRRRRRTAPTAS